MASQSLLCGKPCASYWRKRLITSRCSNILNLGILRHAWPCATTQLRQRRMNICWQTPCSLMRLPFIPVASSVITTAGYGLMNNHTSPWNWNVKLQRWMCGWASPNSAFMIHSFLLKQQLCQHRNWTCLSNSCGPNCLQSIFWILWCCNRTVPYRTLRTLCVIASTRHTQDAGLDEVLHSFGQHARLI